MGHEIWLSDRFLITNFGDNPTGLKSGFSTELKLTSDQQVINFVCQCEFPNDA